MPMKFPVGSRVRLNRQPGDNGKYNDYIVDRIPNGTVGTVQEPPDGDFPEDAVQVFMQGGYGAIEARLLEPAISLTVSPEAAESIRSINLANPDFTVTEVKLDGTWGGPRGFGFRVKWRTSSAGYGDTTFVVDKAGDLVCQNEAMSRDFVKAVLSKLVDSAKFDDE